MINTIKLIKWLEAGYPIKYADIDPVAIELFPEATFNDSGLLMDATVSLDHALKLKRYLTDDKVFITLVEEKDHWYSVLTSDYVAASSRAPWAYTSLMATVLKYVVKVRDNADRNNT